MNTLLEELIKDEIDIFLISKTILDSSSPSGQFVIKGYSTPFRLDRNQNEGGLLLYVRKDIPCKILKEYTPEKPIENFFVEINVRSRKWLLSCSYNPKINLIADNLHCVLVLGDLNAEVSNSFMEQFCASCNLKSLVKMSTSFKRVDNSSCIDLILTNYPKCFQNPGVYETGISDVHQLTFTAFKTYFQKAKPRIIKYRDYKHFDNNEFRNELIRKLSSNNMQPDDLARFTNFSKMVLEKRHL